MNTVLFASQKTMTSTSLLRGRPSSSLEGVSQDYSTASIVFLVSGSSGGPNTHPE